MVKPYYEQDGITIYHGDCREVLPAMPDGLAGLVLTDPPYGVELEYGAGVDDSFDNWKLLIDSTLPQMRRVSAGAVLVSTSKLEGEAHLFQHHMPDWRICWFKGASCTRSHVGFKDWETVFVWGKHRGPQFHDYFHARANDVRDKITSHPCPKPDEWARWLMNKCSLPGDLVVDPFMGSGTTLRAAKDLNRRAVGIDINERYCELAVNRLRQGVLFGGAA